MFKHKARPSSPLPPLITPPSSPNPFDALEQESVDLSSDKIIIPTKYKKKPKKPLPAPAQCKGSQAVVKSTSCTTQTSISHLNKAQSHWNEHMGLARSQGTQTEVTDRPIIPVKATNSNSNTPKNTTSTATKTTTNTKRKDVTSDSDQTKRSNKYSAHQPSDSDLDDIIYSRKDQLYDIRKSAFLALMRQNIDPRDIDFNDSDFFPSDSSDEDED